MDLDQIRTFLAIVDEGNFVRAADMLNVTQSTVSARIRELEVRLGQYLFVRSRAGCTLTSAGRRFEVHARTMQRAMRQAQQDISLPEEISAVLNVGGQHSLWDGILSAWVYRLRTERPDLAVQATVDQPEDLHQQLASGLLDIAITYAARTEAELVAEHLFDEDLVLVTNLRGRRWIDDPAYVFVDWGPEFRGSHSVAFADAPVPGLRFTVGAVALAYVLAHGGLGYFPVRSVRPHMEEGALRRVNGAPRFNRPTYATYRRGLEAEGLDVALDLLRETVRATPHIRVPAAGAQTLNAMPSP